MSEILPNNSEADNLASNPAGSPASHPTSHPTSHPANSQQLIDCGNGFNSEAGKFLVTLYNMFASHAALWVRVLPLTPTPQKVTLIREIREALKSHPSICDELFGDSICKEYGAEVIVATFLDYIWNDSTTYVDNSILWAAFQEKKSHYEEWVIQGGSVLLTKPPEIKVREFSIEVLKEEKSGRENVK